MEQKEVAEQELLMKGTGTFPLERLLAIFQCITSAADSLDEEEHENDVLRVGGDCGLMSDVLLQLSSLCNANFIIKGGSCPLEGSTRYRSTVSEDLALKVSFQSFPKFLTKFSCRGNILKDSLMLSNCIIYYTLSVWNGLQVARSLKFPLPNYLYRR
jgi:hypothetical protein